MTKHLQRFPWARNPLDIKHHDEEWGVPCHDDRALFEMLVLEGAQAGLSWSTILAKRENYRRAFASFDPSAIAGFTAKDVMNAGGVCERTNELLVRFNLTTAAAQMAGRLEQAGHRPSTSAEHRTRSAGNGGRGTRAAQNQPAAPCFPVVARQDL
jgi:hypothetical protein